MNAEYAVPEYAVIRSKAGIYSTVEVGTSEYKEYKKDGYVVVERGTEADCKKFKSPGMIYKEKHGVSRATYRNMRKKGLTSLDEYRKLRKERKAIQKKASQMKADKAKAGKKAKK